jgi:hypothetical protein
MMRDFETCKRVLTAAFVLLAAASCGGNVGGTPPGSMEQPIASVSFPADGVPNDNGYVGPFCCTGRTAIFKDASGTTLGYSYFYDFADGRLLADDSSVASSLGILIAGRSDLDDGSSPLVMGRVDFEAAELEVGARKTVIVGALELEVVVELVDIVELDGQPYFAMSTLAVRVDVRSAAGSSG